jgi:hypothetical protein
MRIAYNFGLTLMFSVGSINGSWSMTGTYRNQAEKPLSCMTCQLGNDNDLVDSEDELSYPCLSKLCQRHEDN